jgi:hypothetical protein
MKARWVLVAALAVSASALGVTSASMSMGDRSISAEPTVASLLKDAPLKTVEPEAQAGLAAPQPTDPIPRTRHRREPHTSLELDFIEPWTGEDLTPVIVAAREARHGLDRVDPWNASVIHSIPPPREESMDLEDPWSGAVSTNRASLRRAKATLERKSPWDDAQANLASPSPTDGAL